MTYALKSGNKFHAVYWNEFSGRYTIAARADGNPIFCDTLELAEAVAEARYQRILWSPA